MLAKLKGNPAGLIPAAAALLCLTVQVCPVAPAGYGPQAPAALAQDSADRPDETMGNPGQNTHTGVNSRGDEVMVIGREPQKKQDIPNMGPIYVMPQVNQGGGGKPPVIVPMIPPQAPAQAPTGGDTQSGTQSGAQSGQ
jgi:hypothetical protein